MGAPSIADAYVQILPTTKGIKGNLEKELNPELGTVGKESGGILGGHIVSAATGAIIAGGIGKALKESVLAGADLQQSLGGIETMFKDSFDKVKGYADKSYKTTGLSANAYMENVTSFSAALIRSLGGDTNAAADAANQALIDMADNANKFGTDMSSIQYAYQGFAKQNYTMLDNLKLGYGGTKSEMERLLADAEELSGVEYDITNLSDVYEAIHVIQDELGVTGTTALEASETFTGSFAAMKAATTDLLGNLAIGEDIAPSLEALKETVSNFLVGNLFPMIGNILSQLPELVPGLLSIGFDLVQTAVTGVAENAPTMIASGTESINSWITGMLNGAPGIVSTVFSLIGTYVDSVFSNLPQIMQSGASILLTLVQGIANNFPQICQSAGQAIGQFTTSIWQNFPQIVQAGIEIVGQLVAGLIRSLPQIYEGAWQLVKTLGQTIIETDWLSIGKNIITGIANGLANAGGQLWEAVKGVLGSFKENVLSFFGIHSPSRWGIWVGAMIDKGLANGLSDVAPIEDSMELIKKTVATPINADVIGGAEFGRSLGGVASSDSSVVSVLLEVLGTLKQLANGKQEIVVNCDDRELVRVLREKGVVFA